MRPSYHAELVNGVWGDPGVCIDLKFQRRALLFDIGDVRSLSTRVLLRVSDVFVSHTHMDHFARFDHLLRVCLGRDTGVRLYGPENFIPQVEHKLSAYTWNLAWRGAPRSNNRTTSRRIPSAAATASASPNAPA